MKEIIRARRVGVTGFRSSHAIAYLLYFLLGQIRKNSDLLEFGLGSLPNQIINYGAQDLLICISLPRYSRQSLASLKYAQKNHCKTIAITDTPISPIGQNADLVLLVGNQSSTYFNSLTGAVSLVNCLVAGVSPHLPLCEMGVEEEELLSFNSSILTLCSTEDGQPHLRGSRGRSLQRGGGQRLYHQAHLCGRHGLEIGDL